MLDFVLMISNVGPPALTLSAIATMCVYSRSSLLIASTPSIPVASSLFSIQPATGLVFIPSSLTYRADLDSDADGAVSRIITLSYAVTPLIALPITASLQFSGKIEDGQ